MKLRIQGNSIRFRLSADEIAHFIQAGRLEEHLIFSPAAAQKLHYALIQSATAAQITATLYPNSIMVILPATMASKWAHSDTNSLENIIENGQAKGLKVLIEKDLDCSHQTQSSPKN